jgi:hypothetical protein
MRPSIRRVLRGLGASLAFAAGVAAAAPVLRDPAVPEALRHTTPAPITRGETLRAQVEAKLRARFAAADTNGEGQISRTQAEAAGLGYVVQHFDAIDDGGHGTVSWAQVRAYVARRERATQR